jgi:STE24 endopeptidase
MPIIPIIDNTIDFPYKELTLSLIVAKILFEEYINFRQYRKLGHQNPLPKDLANEKIKPEEYLKTQIYGREKMGFLIFKNIFTHSMEIALLWFNYWAWLWYQTPHLLHCHHCDVDNEYYRLSVFIMAEIVRGTIINVPFNYYSQFVLEENFGFNKSNRGLFAKDTIIALILKMVFLPVIISGLVWVINEGGEYFYLYAEVAAIVFVLLAMWVIPSFIAPLFNKFEDLEDGPLRESLFKLAEKVEYPLKKIYRMDASKRSSHSNAFLFGFGSNKRIVLFDTLINQLSPPQIEAVLCHELGHWAMYHTVKLLTLNFIQIFIVFYLLGFFIGNPQVYLSFGFYETSAFLGLFIFMFLYTPIGYIFGILSLVFSRKFEYEADHYAFKMGKGNSLQEGLKRLFKENSGDMDPDPIYCIFTHSHPTLMQRIKYIRDLELTHHNGDLEFQLMNHGV